MSGICVLAEEAPESPLAPSTTRGHSEKASAMNQEVGSHQTQPRWCFNLGLPAPELREISFCCL